MINDLWFVIIERANMYKNTNNFSYFDTAGFHMAKDIQETSFEREMKTDKRFYTKMLNDNRTRQLSRHIVETRLYLYVHAHIDNVYAHNYNE